jgi:uncharacterized coiled-coil protein SlyX
MGAIVSYFEKRLHRCDRRLDDLEAQVTKQEIDIRLIINDVVQELHTVYHKLEDIAFMSALESKVRYRRTKHMSLPIHEVASP